jgi:hypothetical protein
LYRVLADRGILLVSVPFASNSPRTITRAAVLPDGRIEHFLAPEYHGNPMSAEGSLCFYHFGWELLDQLQEAGFSKPRVLAYWSREYGYLGREQYFFLAEKRRKSFA